MSMKFEQHHSKAMEVVIAQKIGIMIMRDDFERSKFSDQPKPALAGWIQGDRTGLRDCLKWRTHDFVVVNCGNVLGVSMR